MEIAFTAPQAEPQSLRPAGDSQLNTILTLFLVLRFSLLFLYSPRGMLSDYTDYLPYFRITQLSEKGYYPFINMWSEYPPLTAYAPQIAYWITERVMPVGDVGGFGYDIYSRVLGGLLLIFDSGSLILLHRIAARAWGVQKANWLAWVYASLSLPLYFWSYAHQGIAVFFMLLALYAFCAGQFAGSAVAVGLGFAAKITPAFLLGPAVKFLWPHWRKGWRATGCWPR